MSRGWVWLQLTLAWLPLWALFTALIVMVHGLPIGAAAIAAARMVGPGAILGIGVYRFASRKPWPHPFRLMFVGIHVLAALVYSAGWLALIALMYSRSSGHLSM